MEIITTVSLLLKQLLVAVPTLIVSNTVLTGAFNGAFNVQKGWVQHLISWILAVLVGIFTALSGGLTVFADVWANVAFGAACGLVAGGASNGLYDWSAVANLIDKFYLLFGHDIPSVAKTADTEA